MSKKKRSVKNSQIHTPHDKIFKRSMCIPEVAKEFLMMHLPDDIKNKIDYTTLEIVPETFIDETLSHHQVDVLFKVKCEGKALLIYILIEQQSKPYLTMPVRNLSYKADIWAHHLEVNKSDPDVKLPPIIDLHFYTGPTPYTGPLSIADLAKDNAELINKCLTQPMINIWAGDTTEEYLKTHPWAGTLQYVMKNRRKRNVRPVLRAIAPNVIMFYDAGHTQYVLSLYTYIENVYTCNISVEEFAHIAGEEISTRAEEDIMTMVELTKKQTELNNSIEIAKRLLAKGTKPAVVAEVTELSLQQILKLQTIH